MNSRVDLHPVDSPESSASQDPDEMSPPLDPEADTSHRRRTAFRDILSLRHRPNASAEERITALRRFRAHRRSQSGEVTEDNGTASMEDVTQTRDRRSKRLSTKLSDALTGRSRRDRQDGSPAQQGESSQPGVQARPRDGSPSP